MVAAVAVAAGVPASAAPPALNSIAPDFALKAVDGHNVRLSEYRGITLVDIGGYTVDVLTVHNFRLDRSSCASLRMGTIILYSRIQDALQKSDILLTDELITDAIRATGLAEGER